MDQNWISAPPRGCPPKPAACLLAETGSCWTSALGCIHLCSFAPVIFLMSHNLALINSLKVRLGLDCMYSISSSRPAESCVVVLFQLISRRACPISPPPGNCLPRPAASPAAGTGGSWTPPQSDYFCPGNINTHLLFLSHLQIYLANVLRSPQPKIFFLEKNYLSK